MMIQTERLTVRQLSLDDAAFILQLLNEPSFLRHIGDRGVRNLEDAERYIETGPMESYRRNGFGLYGVALKDSGVLIGMCGRAVLGLGCIVAIASPDNISSAKLLGKLGLRFERVMQMPAVLPGASSDVKYFVPAD